MSDKEIEYKRYNERSAKELSLQQGIIQVHGHEALPYLLQSPFILYEKLIRDNSKPGSEVLDLCCGNGVHSLTAAQSGALVTATDIAENSIELAKLRAKEAGVSGIRFLTADAEKLPFENHLFDMVTCVGSLSYVDLKIFTAEVLRVLKPGGLFICLDSFDHNPIYRLNRFIHYLRGNRSLSTLKRMPDSKTIQYLRTQFASLEINYFGIFSFAGGVLKKIVGEKKARNLIDQWDKRFSFFKKQAFKVVFIARKEG